MIVGNVYWGAVSGQEAEENWMRLKDALDVVAALITIGGLIYVIFKWVVRHINRTPRVPASQPSWQPTPAPWRGPPQPTKVMWRWGLGLGLLAVVESILLSDYVSTLVSQSSYGSFGIIWAAILSLDVVVATLGTLQQTSMVGRTILAGCIAGFLGATATFIGIGSWPAAAPADGSGVIGGVVLLSALSLIPVFILVVLTLGIVGLIKSLVRFIMYIFT